MIRLTQSWILGQRQKNPWLTQLKQLISQNILREGGKKISGKSLVFDQTPLGPPPHLSSISPSNVSFCAADLGIHTRQIWAYIRGRFGPTCPTNRSAHPSIRPPVFLCHLSHWSPFWKTSENAYSGKAWWSCSHLWKVWEEMHWWHKAKDTQGSYMQPL